MKKSRYILIIIAAVVCCNVFAVRQAPAPRQQNGERASSQTAAAQPASGQDGERTIVDIKGRRMFPIELGPDSTAISLVGGVVAYHNGAVITCDSAVRFGDRRIECFGNVIINKDSTYVYGDRADYDADENTAQVFSPLIKMIDGSAVLYTYNFIFNTLDNVGEYYGGGTMQRDNTLIESDKGYYYSDTKDFICVRNVELRDSTYLITSDSLGYNMDTEIATFYSHTMIWNDKGEILSANRGWYYTSTGHYHFTSDAYVLTETQEAWADNMDYWSDVEDVVMRNNIQVREEEQKILAFGDYGMYFGESGNAMLTENPSIISFQEDSDSLYMRGDTIFMYVIDSTSIFSLDYIGNTQQDVSAESEEELIDPTVGALRSQQAGMGDKIRDMEAMREGIDSVGIFGMEAAGAGVPEEVVTSPVGETADESHKDAVSPVDEAVSAADAGDADKELSTVESADSKDSTVVKGEEEVKPQPTEKELAQQLKEQVKRERAEAKALKKQKREAAKAAKAAAKKAKRGESVPVEAAPIDTDKDAPETEVVDEGLDTELTEVEAEVVPEEEKEKERVIVSYRNVKMYRSDFQAVCDSLVAFSRDSTIHLHIGPVLWNGENQITSDLAVIYTKDEQLHRAFFSGGNPIMSAKLDKSHFNQVTGKTIEAFFRDNEMFRTDVVGNGQTYYYMQDEATREYQGFMDIESANITFYIEDRQVEHISWIGDPVTAMYPMDQIPSTQEQQFPNFEWFGHLRPALTDVFNREIRSSRREEYVAIPRPLFPLTDKINAYRISLVKSGTWRDRTDEISADAREFVRQLESQRPQTQ